jgi:hypothetical protein
MASCPLFVIIKNLFKQHLQGYLLLELFDSISICREIILQVTIPNSAVTPDYFKTSVK